MMETRLIPKKFLKLIKNLADENRNYKKIFGNVFWLEVVKEKNYTWFNLRLNSTQKEAMLFRLPISLSVLDPDFWNRELLTLWHTVRSL